MTHRFLRTLLIILLSRAAILEGTDTPGSLEEMTSRSSAIILGSCVSSTSRWESSTRMIMTDSTFRVDRYLKGKGPTNVQVTLPGGTLPERNLAMTVTGGVEFSSGEEVLLFLSAPQVARPSVYEQVHGKRLIQRDAGTGIKVVRGQRLDLLINDIFRLLQNPRQK